MLSCLYKDIKNIVEEKHVLRAGYDCFSYNCHKTQQVKFKWSNESNIRKFKFTNNSYEANAISQILDLSFLSLSNRTGISRNVHYSLQNNPPLDEKSFFWTIKQAVMVITYRRFGTTYRSYVQGTVPLLAVSAQKSAVLQSCSVYISICTYSHETQQLL